MASRRPTAWAGIDRNRPARAVYAAGEQGRKAACARSSGCTGVSATGRARRRGRQVRGTSITTRAGEVTGGHDRHDVCGPHAQPESEPDGSTQTIQSIWNHRDCPGRVRDSAQKGQGCGKYRLLDVEPREGAEYQAGGSTPSRMPSNTDRLGRRLKFAARSDTTYSKGTHAPLAATPARCYTGGAGVHRKRAYSWQWTSSRPPMRPNERHVWAANGKW